MVEAETGCCTVIENDAVAYAVYEQKSGVGFDTDSFALLLIRDGIGGAVVLDHHVVPIPCEVGHLNVTTNGRECPCGSHGCVESIAGRRAIRAIVGERMHLGRDAANIQEAISLADGDHGRSEDAVTAFREAGEAVAFVIGSLLTMFGVSHVVIYCDEAMMDFNSRAVAKFHAGVDTFAEYAFPVFSSCRLERRRWRSTDGAYGAGLLALNQLFHVRVIDPHLHHQPRVVQES
jgi:predicted NBD/HSP70 family sugar kinase